MFIETNLCGPLRIASNGVDSVVIGGNEKSLIIDASTSFRVSTTIGPPSLSNAEDRSNSESDSHHIVEQRLEKKFETEDRKKSQLASTFELKVEHKIEHIVPHVEARRWDSGQIETVDPSNSRQEYIDDLPPLDIVDDVEEEEPLEVLPVERCYLNKEKLTAEILIDMASEKRNLSRILKQYNTQLRTYCSPEHEARDESFRNCPLWREEKMIHYYKLMRLLYCSDYNLWPNAPKIKRSFGANLQLFEKLYAFLPKQ
ncbi:unnamed protein product [Dracunculus medinensis]|uniref:Uncharacterized protein n=1 Tax=Dracunculus medinensis TaxID=318479 RepID=A0A158Q579_DRAME|nr:unnamed protein product [Dracunculus medinensis]